MTSANDDGSGCANLLEIGRALARLIKEGKLPRPRRDIRFWWVNEFASQEQFFRENPGEPRRMLAEPQPGHGGRAPEPGRPRAVRLAPALEPAPRARRRDGERAHHGARRQHLAAHHARHRACRSPSRARSPRSRARASPTTRAWCPTTTTPTTTPSRPRPIGVPGTSLTNWPDEFIHSTGDDLEQIDATQLERNAVVVAGGGPLLRGAARRGRAGRWPPTWPRAAVARLAADLATAVAHLAQAARRRRATPPSARPATWCAPDLPRGGGRSPPCAGSRPRGRAADYVAAGRRALEEALARDLRALERAWTWPLTGKNPPERRAGREEQAMAAQVFVPVPDIGASQDAHAEAEGRRTACTR